MNTSYKSLFQPFTPAPVEAFHYAETEDASGAVSGAAPEGATASDNGDEIAQLLLRAHAEGVREGEDRERIRGQQHSEQERAKVTEAILRFQTSVSEYYSRTELEVVQLALAIAAKILHREAQADPALLSKLVKAVLENLHQSTEVKVRVPLDQVEAWRAELAPHEDERIALEVIGDESVDAENCILETELGSTAVGIAAQLREIETGMFDLLALNPVETAAPNTRET